MRRGQESPANKSEEKTSPKATDGKKILSRQVLSKKFFQKILKADIIRLPKYSLSHVFRSFQGNNKDPMALDAAD
jgi:hypothetical protein